jgi:hypothetical protein
LVLWRVRGRDLAHHSLVASLNIHTKRTQSINNRGKKGEKKTHHLVTHLAEHQKPAVEATFNTIVAIVATLGPILANGAAVAIVDANDEAARATL